ncbi:MAG: glycosyl hydrolase [Bacteroidetes bacterium]|nr:glycosyl hydrolase [Bacteroidota bacterium]
MRKLLLFFLMYFGISVFSQKIMLEPLLQDEISIRAILVDEGKIIYSSTNSTFGILDYSQTIHQKKIKISDKKLQFRTLAQDRSNYYTINIEQPAYFFKIDKKTLESVVVFTDFQEKSFYDALIYDAGKFYTFSDPEKDGKLKFISFQMGDDNFQLENIGNNAPKMIDGEAAFAASNTNIAFSSKYIWLATGGQVSRIWRYQKNKNKWEVFSTPFVQGKSSQGMYSIDFLDNNFGVAVGGDYTNQAANENNIAITKNGGKTWKIVASGKNEGYMTCVKIRPNTNGREMIAVGDNHISYSKNFGNSWTKLSDEKGLYVCEWIDENTLAFAGKGKILKGKLIE